MGERSDLEFPSAQGSCAGWLYRPEAASTRPGPCVVMAHGFSLTRHDGLPAFAERLAGAGATVLVFDHRHLGDSPGEPRQHFSKPAQRQDWRSAVARLAARAPKAELHRYPYDHWQPCVGDASARIAADQIDFLRRHGLLGA